MKALKYIFYIFLIFIFVDLSLAYVVFAETIILKSRQKVTGEIIEENDEYIKVKIGNVRLTYYPKEIERVEKDIVFESLSTQKSKPKEKIDVATFGSQALSKLKDIDYEGFFNGLYLPASYKNEQILQDKEAITQGLKYILEEKLGVIVSFERVNRFQKDVVAITLWAGDPTGASPFEDFDFLFYQVQFAFIGQGYIVLKMPQDYETNIIKDITFALPGKNLINDQLYQDIMSYLMKFAK